MTKAATDTFGTTTRPDAGRARFPDRSGVVTARDGVRIAFDVYGSGATTIVLLPSAPIIHARQWKGQIPYLSRHHRVVAFDGRGNGRSDRPLEPTAYTDERFTTDIATVMDATDTDRAVLVGLCSDAVWRAVLLAAAEPQRVDGIVAFAVGVPLLTPPLPWRVEWSFEDELPTDEGWAKLNRHYWRRDYPGFAQFWFEQTATEPHSTKLIEDCVAWTLDGSADAMLCDSDAPSSLDIAGVEATCRAVRCPLLLVHGTEDHCQPLSRAQRLSELTGAPLVVVDGADHLIPGRYPVLANLLVHDFVRSVEASR